MTMIEEVLGVEDPTYDAVRSAVRDGLGRGADGGSSNGDNRGDLHFDGVVKGVGCEEKVSRVSAGSRKLKKKLRILELF